MLRFAVAGVVIIAISGTAISVEPAPFTQPEIKVPEGYTVELAAAPPLVEHPLMAHFDDRGRLYIAENSGVNMQRAELEEKLPNYVSRLEDTDGDGRFDKRTIFADKLTFPQGALWHDGWLYVASSGAIWRFTDKDDDGVAEVRERIVGRFGYTGNAADVHGCFLGPDGRIWWCEGRHGHDIKDADGKQVSKGKAARIFSCRTDGSDVRVHCGGGMDNPVEIDWTPEGELLGTVNILYHKRGDCIVHWMHGGAYPRLDQPEMIAEFRRTGEPLDAVHDYGHVAVSGCCRIRGAGFQPAVKDSAATFLVTQFNTHKVVSTTLVRDGSTFRAEVTDFLQAASDDFHPTDVLEDADGSLLVIDTGGWFRIGCPTSQIAKPNILGAIYRIRRTDTPKIDDPRGLSLDWHKLDATSLVKLLGDSRPAVRERAIATLSRQGDTAVPYLSRALVSSDAAIRLNATWCLTRIGTPKAQGSVRLLGLAQKDQSALAAAVYSCGTTRDAEAVGDLCELLTAGETPPQIARQAATALGQIGDAAAVPALLTRLHGDADRVLEHALIYALIEIADRDATANALADDSPRVRRAALIALDQMPSGNLTREEVAALLDTTDQPLLAAALDVISRREGWADELIDLASKLLEQKELSEPEQSLLSGALVGLAKNDKVQALVGKKLAAADTTQSINLLLLDVIGRSDLRPLPETWVKPLKSLLAEVDGSLTYATVVTVSGSEQFDELLTALARKEKTHLDARTAAYAAILPRLGGLPDSDFSFLAEAAKPNSPAPARTIAAQVLADASLSATQKTELFKLLLQSGPVEVAALLPAFGDIADANMLRQIANKAVATKVSVPASITKQFLKHVPEIFEPKAESPSSQRRDEMAILVEVLEKGLRELPSGGVDSGKQVFFGRKGACSSCHRVASEGGKIGPDLSKVGERRSERDLLEAVIVPSASVARGYESQTIRTADGRTLTGLVVRETAESLFLRTNDQREIRLRRSDIEEQKPSELSIMPAGLENTMSRQELADLLAYLKSLK